MLRHLLIGYLLFILAAILQLQFKAEWGGSPDFVLAIVFVLAFALDFWELLPVLLFGAWILNWQPVISQELIYFIVLPITAFVLKRALPWQPWLGAAVYALGGVICFYLLSGLAVWRLATPGFLLLDAATILLWSWSAFALLRPSTDRMSVQGSLL